MGPLIERNGSGEPIIRSGRKNNRDCPKHHNIPYTYEHCVHSFEFVFKVCNLVIMGLRGFYTPHILEESNSYYVHLSVLLTI